MEPQSKIKELAVPSGESPLPEDSRPFPVSSQGRRGEEPLSGLTSKGTNPVHECSDFTFQMINIKKYRSAAGSEATQTI